MDGIAFIALYMLPAMIASLRSHPNTMTIGILNAFLGWTVLGWILCLAWAASAKK